MSNQKKSSKKTPSKAGIIQRTRSRAQLPGAMKVTANPNKNTFFNFGNQLWKLAKNPGRRLVYPTPKELWLEACKYFDWVANNPLWEEKLVSDRGSPVRRTITKLRPYTLGSLCIFLGITLECYGQYRRRPDFVVVTGLIDQIIREQKFEGAAAGLFNSNIIARDIGLTDKQEITGAGGSPLNPHPGPVVILPEKQFTEEEDE